MVIKWQKQWITLSRKQKEEEILSLEDFLTEETIEKPVTETAEKIETLQPVQTSEEPIDELTEKLDVLKAKMSYCADHLIKAGTYPGFEEDVMTVAIPAMLVCSTDLSEDLVYNITKVIFEHTKDLIAAHVRGKDITVETALNGMSIPLHPGAEKYYKEMGILK